MSQPDFNTKLNSILADPSLILPIDQISTIVGYGSAMFPQKLDKPRTKQPMVDLLVVTPNLQLFHKSHYNHFSDRYNSKLTRLTS